MLRPVLQWASASWLGSQLASLQSRRVSSGANDHALAAPTTAVNRACVSAVLFPRRNGPPSPANPAASPNPFSAQSLEMPRLGRYLYLRNLGVVRIWTHVCSIGPKPEKKHVPRIKKKNQQKLPCLHACMDSQLLRPRPASGRRAICAGRALPCMP